MEDLDLKSHSLQEDFLIETSYLTHYPLCSTACNAFSSSNELAFESTQGSDIIHDQEEGNEFIVYPFHPLSFSILHEENSSIQVTHEIHSIYSSLDVQFEEHYDLGNMFVEYVSSNQINDVNCFHKDNSDLVKITSGSCPHTMHGLIQFPKCNSTILESSETHQ